MNKEKKIKLSRLLDKVSCNFDDIFHPAYVRYTKEWSMSPVDPSYIYSYIVGGVRKPKLSNKMPKLNDQYDKILEYGFNKDDQCLYCKMYDDSEPFMYLSYYVYEEDAIYRIDIEYCDFHQSKEMSIEEYHKKLREMKDFDFTIYNEYYFDKKHRPLKIICNYWGLERNEEYQWLNEDVAIVKERRNSYILIKNNETVLGVFSIEYGNTFHQKFSYQSQGYIDLDHYMITHTRKLEHPILDIEYSLVHDINKKATEYYELKMFDKKYLIFINYMKPPKDFSYKKAKELYKKEIIDYIDYKMNHIEFAPQLLGIQYGNFGYSILDPFIGIDDGNNDDIQTMKDNIEFEFSLENKEIISMLDDYIKVKGYYQSFHKLMLSIKKEIIEKYHIQVILDEIVD